MKKFINICGTRPHLMKVDPTFPAKMIWTGQHSDPAMKDVFFKELKLPKPDYELGETELGAMIDGISMALIAEEPHYVIVYGDTRSTVAGAIAAHQLNIPIIHVEAGVRSGNLNQIEERNRILVDSISAVHLCPSIRGLVNLQEKGLADNAHVVGCANYSTLLKVLPTERLVEEKYCLLTTHRLENRNDENLKGILEGVSKYPGKVIFPIHPGTRKYIKDHKISVPANVELRDPMGYKEFVSYMGHAEFVITDSGGTQNECYFLRTPCITLRKETEWKESIEEGWSMLVGTDPEVIQFALESFKVNKGQHNSYAYGKGNTHSIMRAILNSL